MKSVLAILLSSVFSLCANAEECSNKQLEQQLRKPSLVQAFNNYQLEVSSKYSLWTTKVEEMKLEDKLSGLVLIESRNIGDTYARSVVDAISALENKARNMRSEKCKNELVEYIKQSGVDFKAFHQDYKEKMGM